MYDQRCRLETTRTDPLSHMHTHILDTVALHILLFHSHHLHPCQDLCICISTCTRLGRWQSGRQIISANKWQSTLPTVVVAFLFSSRTIFRRTDNPLSSSFSSVNQLLYLFSVLITRFLQTIVYYSRRKCLLMFNACPSLKYR